MRGTKIKKISLLAAASAVAVVTVGACSSNGQASPTNTGASASQGGQSVNSVAQLADLVSKTSTNSSAHIQFSGGADGETVSGTGEMKIAGADSAVNLDMTTPVGEMDMVLAGQALYIKLPPSIAKTAKPWVKIDANGTDPVSKMLGSMFSQEQQQMDPGGMLDKIKEFATIRQSNPDTVDGQPATHYALTVDTQKMLNSSAVTPQMRQALQSSGAKLPATIPYDIWVNSQNLPVKFTMTEPVQTQQGSQTISVTMTFTDWGQPVTITAPPADQVGPMPTN
jgi:hypothetical protein